jgi:hypothetical protein
MPEMLHLAIRTGMHKLIHQVATHKTYMHKQVMSISIFNSIFVHFHNMHVILLGRSGHKESKEIYLGIFGAQMIFLHIFQV